MVSEVDRIWAAGLFEGEGSVRIAPPTHNTLGALVVDIPNTDRQIVEFFHARWEGRIREYRPGGVRRPYFRWRAAARVAAAFLRDIEPHVRTARCRDRVALGLEYQAQKSLRAPDRDAYKATQRDYYDRMAVLNRRGQQGQLEIAGRSRAACPRSGSFRGR